jgi:hypothetical protein
MHHFSALRIVSSIQEHAAPLSLDALVGERANGGGGPVSSYRTTNLCLAPLMCGVLLGIRGAR